MRFYRKIQYLTREFSIKLHAKTDMVYSRARFVHCTGVKVLLNEGMGWVEWILRWKLVFFRGWIIFVPIGSSIYGLDRVVSELVFLWDIGLPEAKQGKIKGAFMEWYIDSNGVTVGRLDLWEGGNDQDPH